MSESVDIKSDYIKRLESEVSDYIKRLENEIRSLKDGLVPNDEYTQKLLSMDADYWAKEFCKSYEENSIDYELMVRWFENAMSVQKLALYRRQLEEAQGMKKIEFKILNKDICKNCHKEKTDNMLLQMGFIYWCDSRESQWNDGIIYCLSPGNYKNISRYEIPLDCPFIVEHTVSNDNE